MLPQSQEIFLYTVAGLLFLLVLSLIRKKQLRENYILLWLFISLSLLLIIYEYELLTSVASFFSASPNSLLMFCGMIALMLLILQLSLVNSFHTTQLKNLAQKISLLENKLNKIKKNRK